VVFMYKDVTKVLLATNDSVSWRRLASTIQGGANSLPMFSHKTVRKDVMSLPDLSYEKTANHPKLDLKVKARRYQWGIAFWIFWNTAKQFANKVCIVLVHMDEKWFYAIVV
jgi:hypothetical protein